jgi:hypothetical protein
MFTGLSDRPDGTDELGDMIMGRVGRLLFYLRRKRSINRRPVG